MNKFTMTNLFDGEKLELLRGPFESSTSMPWFTKEQVLSTIKEQWDFYSFHIRVHKILWDSEFPWFRYDKVVCEETAFDMYKTRDLDELVGYLFQASIDGYSIRYVSTDVLTGMFLERTNDNSTNIDEDVLSTLVEVVEKAVMDKKPRDD